MPAKNRSNATRKLAPSISKLKQARAKKMDLLRRTLTKQPKEKLVEVLVDLADSETVILRDLESKFDVESPLEDLNEETRQAIADATAFDIRDMNRNFRYDYSAYERIVRNFTHMTKQGILAEAMELALDLMKRGSYQVEMSDEGMMIDELEDCLRVVVRAVDSSSLAVKDKVSWLDKLRILDRTKYLLTKELHRQYR